MIERIKIFFGIYPTFGGVPRSSSWSRVRKDFITKNPECAVCGTKGSFLKPNEVHHKQSFATRPSLELLESNLQTGCRLHHLWIYHLGNYKSLNEKIDEDILIWSGKIKTRPKWSGTEWIYPIKP